MILLDFLKDIAPPLLIMQVLTAAFFAILFLQSGLDKIFDWKNNLEWLNGHFYKTFLKNLVSPMLATVLVTEMLAGLCSALGVIEILFYKSLNFALLGAEISALTFVMLFFGQRIAKDYTGAWTLATYFTLTLLAITLFSMPLPK